MYSVTRFFFSFFLFVHLFSLLIDGSIVVDTTYGKVGGIYEDSVYKFRSIPYAKPPTGDLRWQNPVPPDGKCLEITIFVHLESY